MEDIGQHQCATRPKQRVLKPGYMLRPASRAAFTRGCKCSTIPGLEATMRLEGGGWIHADKCPLKKQDDRKQEGTP